MYSYAEKLGEIVSSLSGHPIDMTQLFEYFTFDVMGDINFGVRFDCLKNERRVNAIEIFKKGMKLMGPFTPLPWLFHDPVSVPGLKKNWLAFRSWADNELQKRLKVNRMYIYENSTC